MPEPGVQDASQALAELVARLRRAMRRAARVALPAMPLSVAQLELLAIVAEHPRSRSGDLAELLRLAPNSVSTLANALLATGMLARAPGRADRRTVAYTLTDRGRAAVAEWQQANETVLAYAFDGLAPARRRTLIAALPALFDLVDRIDAVAGPPTGDVPPARIAATALSGPDRDHAGSVRMGGRTSSSGRRSRTRKGERE